MKNGIRKVIEGLGLYFYKLAEESEDVFWVRSPNLKTQLYVSPAFCAVWKHTRNELYTNPSLWLKSILPQDRSRVLSAWSLCIKDPTAREQFRYNYHIIDKNGKEQYLEEIMFPVFSQGEVVGVAGITKKVPASTHNQDSHEKKIFKTAFEQGSTVYWLKDSDGNLLDATKNCGQLWDVEHAKITKKPGHWKYSVHPDDQEKVTKVPSHTQLRQKKPHTITYRVQDQDKKVKWLRDSYCTLAENSSTDYLIGYTEDVTAIIKRERELTAAIKEAERAENTKSKFLAMMSHELRTPLNAILGMAQILNSTSLDQHQVDQLDVIISSGKSLLSSLNDLLDFAKLDVGNLDFDNQDTNLEHTLAQTVEKFSREHLLNRHIRLDFSHDPVIPCSLYIDARRIQQVLNNLLLNSLRYTQSGNISIDTKCIQVNRTEAVVRISVKDSGCGMDAKELSNLFSPSDENKSIYRNQESLTMTIVKDLVEKMGGSLAISSEPGKGSLFSCIIPMPLNSIPPITKNERRIPKTPDQRKQNNFNLSVLVVEDNPINQKITKIMLEQVGCRVDIADCGLLAIEKMRKNYDMVFMDIGLPDIDGFETTSKIRSNQHDSNRTPIVAMTAHVFNQDRERCFQVGMDEVIAKPILREDLIAILKRWAHPVTV